MTKSGKPRMSVKVLAATVAQKVFNCLIGSVLLAYAILLSLLKRKPGAELIWGPLPIMTNKYWSRAMAQAGWKSKTLMRGIYSINRKDDYDLYFDDLVPRWIRPSYLRPGVAPYFALLYTIKNAAVVHIPFSGGPLGGTRVWRSEARLFRWAGIRTMLLPYGADTYRYSQVIDPSLRHALLLSYPDAAKREQEISERVRYWLRHADSTLCGFGLDGMGRWDVAVGNMVSIDTEQWQQKRAFSSNDGTTGKVTVIHTPNHRGFKGTEFVVAAVEELQREGLKIELVLLEGIKNDEVRRIMQRADIMAEQLIATGYGLSAIEGM